MADEGGTATAGATPGATADRTGGQTNPTLALEQLRRFVENARGAFGTDDLVKQAFADLNALQRQEQDNHFQGRLQYAQQVAEHDRRANDGLVEYGLQTLRWSFLLNAGAIAIMVAYIGNAVGRTPGAQLSSFAPLIEATVPFAIGCALVVVAGAAGYFNFTYSSASLPSAEALYNFLNPQTLAWPPAKFQRDGESARDFYRRYSWRATMWRYVAIMAAFESAFFFVFGVFMTVRAVAG